MHEIGVRETISFLGLTFNIETLKMTWLAMGIVLLIACLATRNLRVVPQGWQNFVEMIILWLHDQIDAMMGRRGRQLAPFIVGLFMFLLASNLIGLVPLMASPTNDLNTTLGLALLVVCMVHCLGTPVFVIINMIEEIAKPITLAFRLFGNILAGEILIIVLLKLMPIWMPIPSVCWLAFSIFISCVQAVIFTMLSMAYLANAVKEDHAE